jgi:hypothetical protein
MRRVIVVLALIACALPTAAAAGGWATVQLSSLPTGTSAGDTWKAELLVLQHGRTPLEGVSPVIRIRGGDGTSDEFQARPTGEPGRYAADVVFPASGTWQWEIWDGFSQTHTYAPVTIGDGSGAGDSFPALPLGLAVVAAVGAVALGLATLRRRTAARPALD